MSLTAKGAISLAAKGFLPGRNVTCGNLVGLTDRREEPADDDQGAPVELIMGDLDDEFMEDLGGLMDLDEVMVLALFKGLVVAPWIIFCSVWRGGGTGKLGSSRLNERLGDVGERDDTATTSSARERMGDDDVSSGERLGGVGETGSSMLRLRLNGVGELGTSYPKAILRFPSITAMMDTAELSDFFCFLWQTLTHAVSPIEERERCNPQRGEPKNENNGHRLGSLAPLDRNLATGETDK